LLCETFIAIHTVQDKDLQLNNASFELRLVHGTMKVLCSVQSLDRDWVRWWRVRCQRRPLTREVPRDQCLSPSVPPTENSSH